MAWAMALALFKRALEERVSASGSDDSDDSNVTVTICCLLNPLNPCEVCMQELWQVPSGRLVARKRQQPGENLHFNCHG